MYFARCLALALAFSTVGPVTSAALPQGRAWSAVIDTFKLPGHTFSIAPSRLETDQIGRPLVFVEALGGIGQDMYVLRWADSSWQALDHLGYGTKGVEPVPSPEGTYHLLWGGLEEIMTDRRVTHLVMSEFAGDLLGRTDTVTTIDVASLTYAATASPVRRWAAAGDYGDLRLLYSDTFRTWTEIPISGGGDNGLAMAAIDDTSALLVWRDQLPGAGILRGSSWTPIAAPPMTGLFDAGPRLRPRPNGGFWLSWATVRDFVGITHYRDGIWSPPESVFCAYRSPEAHYAQSRAEMSRDGGEYPAVSWMAVSSRTGLTSVCVCVPSDSGFTMAENLVGSDEGISPVVARDRNQDVWVAWRAPSGMGWTHTYTQATAGTPTIADAGGERVVAWALSEPAPGSWWAVLRAGDRQTFQEVARVRASEELAMNWTDPSPATDSLHYRIRRECLDTQYQWLSDEVLWPVEVPPSPPPRGRLLLVRASSNPASLLVRFEVLNASAGPMEVQVYDLRGRLLMRQQSTAEGSGRDTVDVDPTSVAPDLAPGLYFLRVVDASGAISPSAKFLFLR